VGHVSGFTLMEILLAISIFSIIVTIIFGSYRSIFSSVEIIYSEAASNDMAANCLNRMILDLQSVFVAQDSEYSAPEFDSPPDPYRVVGDAVYLGSKTFGRLRFTSIAHVGFGDQPMDGIAEIVYYVHPTESDDVVLRRADHLFPYEPFEPKGSDPMLCRYVRSVSFAYYDADGETYETWDSEDESFELATPKAIGIQIEFGKGEETRLIETMVNLPIYRREVG